MLFRSFVYHGSVNGLSTSANVILVGFGLSQTTNDISTIDNGPQDYGYSVSTAGDVNNDGYSDVIVGAPKYYFFQDVSPQVLTRREEGTAFIYHGNNPATQGSLYTSHSSALTGFDFTGGSGQEAFGYSVASAGDVNGDGASDVVIGDTEYHTDEGIFYVFHGTSLASGSPSYVQAVSYPPVTVVNRPSGSGGSIRLGSSVSSAGDVNGDGFSDVIIGAENDDGPVGSGSFEQGGAYIFNGSTSGTSSTFSWYTQSHDAQAHYGNSVGTAGDVNGDGFADVIIGAHRYDNPIVGGSNDLGGAFVYQGGANPVSEWYSHELNQVNAKLGSSVSTAGDVNGDGLADIIMGAPEYDNGSLTDAGSAYVYFGSTNNLATTASVGGLNPNWSRVFHKANSEFGSDVNTAGDVNGDGFSDIVIGVPKLDTLGLTDCGAVYVFYGSSSGPSTSPSWIKIGVHSGDEFGTSVSTAGDVNGDGFSDIVIGTPKLNRGQTNEGAIYLYNGSINGLSNTPSFFDDSDLAGSFFGASVANAGDLNGDGYSDIVVGLPQYSNVQNLEGAIRVYYGSLSGPDSTSSTQRESGSNNAAFGSSVNHAGDVNGDGFSDVIIGAPRFSNGQADEGAAFIYLGSISGLAPSYIWQYEANDVRTFLGTDVSGAGDTNGDGYAEVVVGAPLFNNENGSREGAFLLFPGSPSGPSNTIPPFIKESKDAGSLYGFSVCNAGDVDGDSHSDIIVGAIGYNYGQTAEGRVYVSYGKNGRSYPLYTKQYNKMLNAMVQTNNGSFNQGSKFGVGHFSKSPISRMKAKLVWEIRPHGTPFSGSPTIGNSVVSTGEGSYNLIDLIGTELKSSVIIPNNDAKRYAVRTRVKYHYSKMIDGQPYSRWYYLGIGDEPEMSVKSMSYIMQKTISSVSSDDKLNVSVYPNPVNQSLSINGVNLFGTINIKMISLLGGIVLNKQIIIDGETVTIDIEGLAAGSYILQIVQQEETSIHKVVKE